MIKTINSVLLCITILVMCAACTLSGKRLFQAKVPAPIVKSSSQIEVERRAADLIARKLETPVELKPTAAALSSSLGAPNEPIKADLPGDLPKAASLATAELQTQVVAMQKQIAKLNRDLEKYEGKSIEGTGFNILGPSTVLIVGGLCALGVICPGALTAMFFVLRRMRTAFGVVTTQIEKAAESPDTKAAVDSIKSGIGDVMDHLPTKQGDALRAVIRKVKTA